MVRTEPMALLLSAGLAATAGCQSFSASKLFSFAHTALAGASMRMLSMTFWRVGPCAKLPSHRADSRASANQCPRWARREAWGCGMLSVSKSCGGKSRGCGRADEGAEPAAVAPGRDAGQRAPGLRVEHAHVIVHPVDDVDAIFVGGHALGVAEALQRRQGLQRRRVDHAHRVV